MGVTGRQGNLAFAKYGTGSWGVAASVTRGVYFTSLGGMKLQPARVNDNAFGQAFIGRGDLGNVAAPNLTLTGRSRYNDHNYILDALAMGSPAAVTIATSASGQTTSWNHQIDLAQVIEGLGITLAADKVLYVDELSSAVVYGFSEKVSDGGSIDRTYKVLGSKPTNTSTTNTRSTVNQASFPSLSNRVMMAHGVFRLNAQSGSSLSSTDAQTVESVEVMFERPQDGSAVFGQDYIGPPADNGWPTASVKVKWNRMLATNAQSLYAALIANTAWKADLTYSGAYINSTDTFKRLYQFPALELDDTNGFDFNGAAQIKPEATFTAKLALSSPSGMAFINPFRLTLTQQNSLIAF